MSQSYQTPTSVSRATAPTASTAATPFPAAVPRGLGLGLAAAFATALTGAVAYSAIGYSIDRQASYAAVAVGLLVGLAAGKAGGRSPLLPVVSAVLSLGALHLGQLLFIAFVIADVNAAGLTEVLADQGIGGLAGIWRKSAEVTDYAFPVIGAALAFGAARKAGAAG
ncbi:hypothetical protein ABZZ17_01930 [Streptomyces sp. NPDC006512]|uniref:hypothetical protein n=1 Tax=Streptomyces sp. NPDC006512 TaxID=3154307 RepID=UPI0033A73C2A